MLRLMDSGLRGPRENLSLTEALAQGNTNLLRFQHFPPSAIIGRHQWLSREVNLQWCHANKVLTARRMTGGGAIVMGPGLLGWELICNRALLPQALGEVTRLICETVAEALSGFGFKAEFRPRNDIEVAGRKICGTGGYFDGQRLVFQGTVLMKLDVDFMTSALHLPAHKLEKRGLNHFAERVSDLATLLSQVPNLGDLEYKMGQLLARALNLTLQLDHLSTEEEAEAGRIFDDCIGQDSFVNGADVVLATPGQDLRARHITDGGSLDVVVRLKGGLEQRIDQVIIGSDCLITPPRLFNDLEAALRGITIADMPQVAEEFLKTQQWTMLGGTQDDVMAALQKVSHV